MHTGRPFALASRWLLGASLLLIVPAGLVACGEDEGGAPIELRQEDHGQLRDLAQRYFAALKAQDTGAAKDLLTSGVPAATIKKSMDTVAGEGFELVSVGDPEADGSNAVIFVQLEDKDGNAETRKLEFRLEGGEWVVYSPHLKPLS